MGIAKIEKIIDGKAVIVVSLGGRKSLLLKARLVKILGPALKQIIPQIQTFMKKAKENKVSPDAIKTGDVDTIKKSFADMDFDLSPIGGAFAELIERLEPEELLNLATTMMQGVFVDGKAMDNEANFDSEFAGNLGLLYKLMGAVVEVNFGNFFAAVGIGKSPTI